MIRTYQSIPPKKNETAFLAWLWMLDRIEPYFKIDEMRYEQAYRRWIFKLAHKYYKNERKETFVNSDTLWGLEYHLLSFAREKNLL